MNPHDSTVSNIDPFILCFSTLIAPIAITLFGFIGTWQDSSFASIAFWQIALAFEYAGFYLGFSLPLNWLIWRFYRQKIPNLPNKIIWIFFALFLFLFILSRNLAFLLRMNFDPEILNAAIGLILNAIGFVLLQRRAAINIQSVKNT